MESVPSPVRDRVELRPRTEIELATSEDGRPFVPVGDGPR